MVSGRKNSGRKLVSDINVVPYIDVMLVLLVVFMVTAPMMTQGVKVDLPDANAQPLKVEDEQELLIVSVDEGGRYFLNVGENTKAPKTLEQITDIVSKIRKAKPKSQVFVEGDDQTRYGFVVSVMASLQRAGVGDIGLVTESPGPETKKK
ncbi:TolR protein [gamma proteobacterium HdN1]|nr:TolR protein [gamma proteobacterium HdN1]